MLEVKPMENEFSLCLDGFPIKVLSLTEFLNFASDIMVVAGHAQGLALHCSGCGCEIEKGALRTHLGAPLCSTCYQIAGYVPEPLSIDAGCTGAKFTVERLGDGAITILKDGTLYDSFTTTEALIVCALLNAHLKKL